MASILPQKALGMDEHTAGTVGPAEDILYLPALAVAFARLAPLAEGHLDAVLQGAE